MRLHILSDLHLEFGAFDIPDVESDMLVLAGDIHSHTHGIKWAASVARGRQVVYVPGNHEFYGAHLSGLAGEMKRCAANFGVHLLDNDELVFNGVRFLGTTLWTSFALYGSGAAALQAMRVADSCMSDFKLIRYGGKRLFMACDSARLHHAAVQWLAQKLEAPYPGPTVIISHHCPHPLSIPDRFKDDPLTPAFCSDSTVLIERYQPVLWLHGHTHDSYDYAVGATRVICNPRGYVSHQINPAFRPDLVV